MEKTLGGAVILLAAALIITLATQHGDASSTRTVTITVGSKQKCDLPYDYQLGFPDRCDQTRDDNSYNSDTSFHRYFIYPNNGEKGFEFRNTDPERDYKLLFDKVLQEGNTYQCDVEDNAGGYTLPKITWCKAL